MVKKVKYYVWRTGKIGAKALILVGVLCLLSALWFVWRVSQTPLDISFAKDYIELAMRDKVTGSYAKMGQAVLYWPDLKGPLYLQMHDGQIFNKEGLIILSAGQLDVSFLRAGLFVGRIMPKAVIVKQPTLRLIRNEQGQIELDLGGDAERIESNGQTEITTRIFESIARPGRPSVTKGSIISGLEAFAIEDARLFIDDKVNMQTWSLPDFDLSFLSTISGLDGEIHVGLENSGVDKPAIDVHMEYKWGGDNVDITADITSFNVNDIIGKIPDINIPVTQDVVVSAHLKTSLDKNFMPSDIWIGIISKAGSISHHEISDEPLKYEDFYLNATYGYEGKALTLKDAHITLGGIEFFASAELDYVEDKIEGPVKVWANEFAQSKLVDIWPKFLEGDGAERWLVRKMSDGVFKDVKAELNLVAERKKVSPSLDLQQLADGEEAQDIYEWSADVNNLVAEFKAEGMSLDYKSPLEKATNVSASGRFDLDKDILTVDIEKGQLGEMTVGRSRLFFDELIAEGTGDADLKFKLSGEVVDVLRYISTDPINLGDDIGMDLDKVKGKADLDIGLHFPAYGDVRLDEFKIDISGKLNDVLFPDVIKELDLSGGPMDLSVKGNTISLQGEALLEKRPIDLKWEAFLKSKDEPYKERVSAKLSVDPNIRTLLGIDLSDFIEGTVDATVVYTSFRDGTAEADLKADIEPSLFFVDPFDYVKPSGEAGSAELKAYFKNGDIKRISGLKASSKDFTLTDGEIIFMQKGEETLLSSGSASSFTLGETKAKLAFTYDDKRAVDIKLNAEFLDAQPFMAAKEDKGEYSAPPMLITVSADTMRTAPEEVATNVTVYMKIDDKGRFDQMEMDGHIGSSDVFLRYNEQGDKDGKRTFRMKTEDAGALLKAFGVYDNVRGGSMLIYGEPMQGIHDRNLKGRAEIKGFKVVKAPALTKILSILSLTGIGEALSSDGLSFDKLEVDFSWLFRKKGSLLELKNGRTSGNALGLLFEGTFDNEKREVDVSGTIAPMDALNKMIGKIPLVGTLLTGGTGGVFAATYSIKGGSDDPKVSVNPLSVLTPGILRRILWEQK